MRKSNKALAAVISIATTRVGLSGGASVAADCWGARFLTMIRRRLSSGSFAGGTDYRRGDLVG